jgi:hypothetical protein
MMREGEPAVEFNDTGGRTYIGTLRVATGTAIDGNLVVRVADVDDLEAAEADRRKDLPTGPLLPSGTSLISIQEFVPAGVTQGIGILNDSTTPHEVRWFFSSVLFASALAVSAIQISYRSRRWPTRRKPPWP